MARTPDSRRISVALTAVGLALVVVAVVFTETLTTSRVASNATELHWANATTGVAATARASAVQASMLRAGADLGIVESSVVDSASAELQTQFQSLQQWAAVNPSRDATLLDTTLAAYLASLQDVIDALDSGDAASASALLTGSVEENWRVLELALDTAQQAAVDKVESTESMAGLLGLATRVALTLVIPVGAVALYRYRARQQVLAAEAAFESEIAIQKKVAEEKNRLIAGVSHELRTPLTSIFGFAELLSADDRDPDVAEMARVIRSEAHSLRSLVEDFVAASRLTDGSLMIGPTTTDIQDIVSAEVDAVANGASVHLNLLPATVFVDPNLTAQILRNLITNAVVHGGPTVWVSGKAGRESYQLAVSDDGAGVPADVLERSYRPIGNDGIEAVTTGALGLGLFVARGLAHHQGGELHYTRSDGWTHFVLTMPLVADQPIVHTIPEVRTTAA